MSENKQVNPEDVIEFLKEKQNTEETETSRVSVERDRVADTSLPTKRKMLDVGIEKFDQIKVTPQELENYLECVLFDQPLELSVSLYKGKIKLTFKSRNVFEQNVIFQAIKKLGFSNEKKNNTNEDVVNYIETMQTFVVLISLKKINETNWEFTTDVNTAETVDEGVKILLKAKENLEAKRYSEIKWRTLLNGYNVFSKKEQLLTNNIINEDF